MPRLAFNMSADRHTFTRVVAPLLFANKSVSRGPRRVLIYRTVTSKRRVSHLYRPSTNLKRMRENVSRGLLLKSARRIRRVAVYERGVAVQRIRFIGKREDRTPTTAGLEKGGFFGFTF